MTKNTRGVSPLVRSGFHLQPASDQSSLKVLQFVEKQLAQFNPSQTLSSSPNCKTNTVQMLDHCMIHSTHSASLFSCVRAACLTLPFPLSSSVFSKAAVFKLFKSPVLMCDNCTTLRSRVPRRTPEGCSLFQNQISVGASEVSKGSLAVTRIYFDISYFIQSIVMINTMSIIAILIGNLPFICGCDSQNLSVCFQHGKHSNSDGVYTVIMRGIAWIIQDWTMTFWLYETPLMRRCVQEINRYIFMIGCTAQRYKTHCNKKPL